MFGKMEKTYHVNKDHCKQYREKNEEQYRKRDRERKAMARTLFGTGEIRMQKKKQKETPKTLSP